MVSLTVACEAKNEHLSAEEVLTSAIEAMDEVETYDFEIDSITSEPDMGTMTAHIKGSAAFNPLVAHIERTSKNPTSTQKSEVYIVEDETYYLMDTNQNLWINVSPNVGALEPAKELQIILEHIELFQFSEDKRGYRFSITTTAEEMKELWEDLFPFFYVMDDPLLHTMMKVIRTESSPLYINYEMIIDKESFHRTSAMMEYALGMTLLDEESENKLTETIYITYDSINEREGLEVPTQVVDNAKTYGEILFGERGAEEKPSLVTAEKRGNAVGNHLNGSYFATDGQTIFYSNWMQESGIYQFTDDESEKVLISNVFAVDLNVTDEWLYFSDEKDGFNVYRMKKNGTDLEKVTTDYAIDLQVVDDWIFYKTNNPLNKTQPLYMVHPENGVKLQLIDNLFRYMIYEDHVIYQKEPQGVLYLLEIDEQGQAYPTTIDYPVRSFIVEDGWIYFESAVDDAKIYRVRLDGTELQRLAEDESQGFNVAGDALYFTNVSEGHSLYKLNLNTLEKEKLDDRGSHIHIINDQIYYSKHISGLELGWFQMNLDGSSPERSPF